MVSGIKLTGGLDALSPGTWQMEQTVPTFSVPTAVEDMQGNYR